MSAEEHRKDNVPAGPSVGMASTSTGLVNNGGNVTAQYMAPSVITGNDNTVNLHMGGASQPLPERVTFNVQDCIGSFTGRDDILKQLHAEIQQKKAVGIPTVLSQTRVISGMGGVGKTETVRRYIQIYKKLYDHIIWINAENYSEARNWFLKLATSLHIRIATDERRREDTEIADDIYNTICQKLGLFVFDNVESFNPENDGDNIEKLLPGTVKVGWKPPAIIITTRDRSWKKVSIIELGGLNHSECFDLLISQLEFTDSGENRALANEITVLCEGLPLVVQQVIAFIRIESEILEAVSKGPYTMRDFLTALKTKRKKFMKTKPADSKFGDVFAVFQNTFERLATRKHGEWALKCLDVMAHLNPDNIPTELVKHLVGVEERTLAKALNLLNRYNLVTRCSGFYTVHRMIQAVKLECEIKSRKYNRIGLDEIIRSFSIFLEALPINADNVHDVLDNGIRVAAKLKDIKQKDGHCMNFHDALGRKLYAVGRHADSSCHYRNMSQLLESTFGGDYPLTLIANHNLGNSLRLEGKYADAENIIKSVHRMYYQRFGPKHQNTLQAMHTLGLIFHNRGHLSPATKYLEHILLAQEETLDLQHPDTLETMGNLASFYSIMGDQCRALDLCDNVIKSYSKIYSPSHLKTLEMKIVLADIKAKMSRYKEANEVFTEILPKLSSELGPKHPKTLSAYNCCLSVLQNIEKQEEVSLNVVNKSVKTLGTKHPQTLDAQLNHAVVLTRKGKYSEAAELFEDVLQLQLKVLGACHERTLATQRKLAATMINLGKYDEPRRTLQEVLEIQKSVLGLDHKETILTKGLLADAFIRVQRFGEAREIFEEILVVQRRTLAPNHPDLLLTKSKLALVFYEEGKSEKGKELADSIPSGTKISSEDVDKSAVFTKLNLARIFTFQQQFDEAEALYNIVLESYKTNFSFDHHAILQVKHELAVICSLQGKLDKARKLHDENLKIRMQILGEEHVLTLETKMKLGQVLAQLENYEDAVCLFADVLQSKVQNPDHLHIKRAARHDLA